MRHTHILVSAMTSLRRVLPFENRPSVWTRVIPVDVCFAEQNEGSKSLEENMCLKCITSNTSPLL